jgi:hypothetical protein
MSQHDLSIANQGFPAFRSDLNAGLQALGSLQSGSTAPSTTYANMLWLDTSANPSVLKVRNADNDAWVSLLEVNQTSDTLSKVYGLVVGTDVQAYDADTAKTDTAQTYTAGQRGEITALTDGATITPDFADSNNFSVTLGGNRTLANPSNLVAGQSGSIFLTQDGSGSRTLAWGSYWDFAGGGTAPTLSTAAGAVDRVDYIVRSSTSIHAVFTGNYS